MRLLLLILSVMAGGASSAHASENLLKNPGFEHDLAQAWEKRTPGKPLYFLYAAAHGSEWEPGYGPLAFAQRLAEGQLSDVVDLAEVAIKIIPLLNPWGYDHMRRQNAQGVDLNRQGNFQWERFQGRESTKDGTWRPGDYDWKGKAPFTELEAKVYRKIAELPNLYCVLDYHGNTSVTNNKIGILPAVGHPDNELLAFDLQRIANARLRGRHLLRQNGEETASQYLLDRVSMGGSTPFLMNTNMRDKYGLLIELTAGYGESYGMILQTDVHVRFVPRVVRRLSCTGRMAVSRKLVLQAEEGQKTTYGQAET